MQLIRQGRNLGVLAILAAMSILAFSGEATVHAGSQHAPILITSDSGFTSDNGVVGGRGASDDPYLISGWDIGPGNWGNLPAWDYGIMIANTTAYFTISDVTVFCNCNNGIVLSQIENGVVQDSQVSVPGVGVKVDTSDNFQITGNSIASGDSKVISLTNSESFDVSYNRLQGGEDAVVGSSVSDASIVGNSGGAEGGIVLDNVSGLLISQNNLSGHVSIAVLSCGNVTIDNNTASAFDEGIAVSDCSNVLVSNNNASNMPYGNGISLGESSSIEVTSNNLSKDTNGIVLGYYATGNNVTNNAITNNQCGIAIDSTALGQNYIANNAFQGNVNDTCDPDFSSATTSGTSDSSVNPSTLKPHQPILIDGLGGFTASNGVTAGDGTSGNPFIIQGWSIDASGANGIEIRNLPNAWSTPVFFVVRNVFIHSESNSSADIVIDSVQGSQEACFECRNNIFNGVIANSTLVDNAEGIVISSSANIEVSGLSIKNTNIAIDCTNYSQFLQIRTNIISDSRYGVYMRCIINDIFYNTIRDTDYGIMLVNSGSIDAEHNSISTPRGFTLQGTGNVVMASNQISGGAGFTTQLFQYGIDMTVPQDVSVEDNLITNTGPTQGQNGPAGVKVEGCGVDPVTGQPSSCNTVIVGNTISVGNATGVALFPSSGVEVFHNNFMNNMIQAFDQSGLNTWDNGYPSGGNFWSDYTAVDNCSGPQQNICPSPDGIGDTPYVFNYNQDNYPLTKPY